MILGNIRCLAPKICTTTKSLINIRTLTVCEQVLSVPQYCNLDIRLPCDISIAPLDLHKYANLDKIIIKLIHNGEATSESLQLQHKMVDQSLKIFSTNNYCSSISKCYIEAPITADITVNSQRGDIHVSNFSNTLITLETVNGNISASKCHSDKISINSLSGNIILSDVLQAAEIYLNTTENGFIAADRLQGNVLVAATENGNIETKASYCTNSTFTTKHGILELRNAHKNCFVHISKNGKLNMSGFDGTLHASIKQGDSMIQISRLQGSSEIIIVESGTLLLKLAEDCLHTTFCKIESKELKLLDDIVLMQDKIESNHGLDSHSSLLIDGKNSSITLQKATLMEMFNLKSRSS